MRLKFNSEQEYINAVIEDKHFPDKPFYWVMGVKATNQHFRVDKDEVICDFIYKRVNDKRNKKCN
jgi:hypothetical protein